jgi:hypothetical protein
MIQSIVLVTGIVVAGLALGHTLKNRSRSENSFSGTQQKKKYTKHKVHNLQTEIEELKQERKRADLSGRAYIDEQIHKREREIEELLGIRTRRHTEKQKSRKVQYSSNEVARLLRNRRR